MVGIIVKEYAHINRSLPGWDTPNGRIVKSKDHYDRLCKENGMISEEQMHRNVENKKLKPYILSKNTRDFIAHAKLTADSKGRVNLGTKAVAEMVKMGIVGKKVPAYMQLPAHYTK